MANEDPTQPVKLRVPWPGSTATTAPVPASTPAAGDLPPPSMGNSLDKYKFGGLNPGMKSPVSDIIDPSTSTFAGRLKRVVTNASRSNIFAGQNVFKAYALYAWQPEGPSTEGFLELFPGMTNAVHVKARIPELHTWPAPQSLPIANDPNDDLADWATINLYPTFVAMDTSVSQYGLPQPGETIWVRFESADPYAGPVYMGKVFKQTMDIQDASSFRFEQPAGYSRDASIWPETQLGQEEFDKIPPFTNGITTVELVPAIRFK